MKVYFISGLGVDRRIFSKLQLPDSLEIHHLDWMEPEAGEDLLHYCRRLARGIDTSEAFALVGLSFGGMVAQTLNNIVQPAYTIIISSIPNRKALPIWFRMAGAMQLHHIFPTSLLKLVTAFTYWLFGAKTREEKYLLKSIIHDTSDTFLDWAIIQIIKWDSPMHTQDFLHIHGSADKVLPIINMKPDVVIPGGEHIMVFSRAEEISKVLTERLMR